MTEDVAAVANGPGCDSPDRESAPTPADVLWAARYLNARATIGFIVQRHRKLPHRYPRVRVRSYSEDGTEALRKFTRIVGVGSWHPEGNGYAWSAQGNALVRRVYDLLWPYLSKHRRKQFRTILPDVPKLRTFA